MSLKVHQRKCRAIVCGKRAPRLIRLLTPTIINLREKTHPEDDFKVLLAYLNISMICRKVFHICHEALSAMGGQLLKPVAQWPSDLILGEEEVKKNLLGEKKRKKQWFEHVLEQDEKYNYRFACNLQINSSYDKLVFGAGCQNNGNSHTGTFSIFSWATPPEVINGQKCNVLISFS